MSSPCEIWHLSDGKPGHLNQVRGLIAALRKRVDLNVHVIDVPSRTRSLWQWMRRKFPSGASLPDPALILGAGQATHLAMLAARSSRGGKTIVMMAPQLPVRWFDLCIVPEHDEVLPRDNIIFTKGAINNIEPSNSASPSRGLILVGGPSKNYDWNAAALTQQIQAVVARDESIAWTLTTSRRTPPDFAAALAALALPNLMIVPAEQTPQGWVGDRMKECGLVWVTEDSVSMVYESLTSGAAVGLLAMPRGRTGRVLRPGIARVMAGLEQLVREQMITTFDAWQISGELRSPPMKIDEADRCGQIVFERFLR